MREIIRAEGASWARLAEGTSIVRYLATVLFLGAIVVLALIHTPRTTEAQKIASVLRGLRTVNIIVERLDKDAESEGITRQMLEDQVLVFIRSKAPGLRYDPSVIPYLYVNLTLIVGGAYAGNLYLGVQRPVEVLVGVYTFGDVPSERIWAMATVWRHGVVLTGPQGRAADHVRRVLDRLLEAFLAEYFRANQ